MQILLGNFISVTYQFGIELRTGAYYYYAKLFFILLTFKKRILKKIQDSTDSISELVPDSHKRPQLISGKFRPTGLFWKV